jgi:hypothetical protein
MSKFNKYHVWTDIEHGGFFPVFAESYSLQDGFFRFVTPGGNEAAAINAQIVDMIEEVGSGYDYKDVAEEMNKPEWENRGKTEAA